MTKPTLKLSRPLRRDDGRWATPGDGPKANRHTSYWMDYYGEKPGLLHHVVKGGRIVQTLFIDHKG